MNKTMIMGVALTLFGAAAWAEWEPVGGNSELAVTLYVDRSTIRSTGSLKRMWSLMDYKSPQTSSGKSYRSSRTQQEFDCKEERYRYRAFSLHAGQMATGEIVYSDSDIEQWKPVAPRTMAETGWAIACGK